MIIKGFYETDNTIVFGTVLAFLSDGKHLVMRSDDNCDLLTLRVNQVEVIDAQSLNVTLH